MLRSDCRATAELLMPPHLHVAHVIAMVRVRCFRSSTAWRWCARSSYVVLRMVEPRNVWRSMTAVSWSERVWAGALHERERSTGTGRAGVWPFAAWRVGDRAGSAVATWRALLTRFLRKCTEIAALYRTAPRAPLRACGCGAQRRLVMCSRLLGSSSRLGLCMHYENESSMYMHTKRSTRACVHARHVGETCSTGLGKYVPWGNWLISRSA